MTFPKDIEPYLIGVWRFREAGRPRSWCATYYYRGDYYDVPGQPTVDAALEGVRDGIKRLQRKAKRARRAKAA
jgi:hypothetical protein